jgi:hypothetical protein
MSKVVRFGTPIYCTTAPERRLERATKAPCHRAARAKTLSAIAEFLAALRDALRIAADALEQAGDDDLAGILRDGLSPDAKLAKHGVTDRPQSGARSSFLKKAARIEREQPSAAALCERLLDDFIADPSPRPRP